MAELQFEIWRDEAAGEQEMGPVTLHSDMLRALTMPTAIRLHSFSAGSDFAAFRKNYELNGWGEWKPEADWTEQFYTVEQAEEQRRYLRERNDR